MEGSGLARLLIKISKNKDKVLVIMHPAAGDVDIPAGKKLLGLIQKLIFGKVELEESKIKMPKLYSLLQ